jgi:hypothetical protein
MKADDKKIPFEFIELIQNIFVSSFSSKVESNENKMIKSNEVIQKCPDQTYTIQCENDQSIKIFKAVISNANKDNCPATPMSKMMMKSSDKSECTETEQPKQLLKTMCQGKMSCEFSVEKHFGKMCECAEQKYLDVTYSCEPTEQMNENEEVKDRKKRSLLYFLAPGLNKTTFHHFYLKKK